MTEKLSERVQRLEGPERTTEQQAIAAWNTRTSQQPKAADANTDGLAEAVEALAKFIANEEAHKARTLEAGMLHRENWRRIIPEAKAMLDVALPYLRHQPTAPAMGIADGKLREALGKARYALAATIPNNLCVTNKNIRDDMNVPIEATMGELRRIHKTVADIDEALASLQSSGDVSEGQLCQTGG